MAQVTCQWCGNKDEKQKCTKGVHSKGYIHIDCIPAYEKEKQFKQREREQQDQLALKIAEVYELESIKEIPSQIWPHIQDLRNDSQLFGKLGKNYKQGIPFGGIAITYEYCKNKIREARKFKEFKNFLYELRYGLAIVRNNLVDAKKDYERKMRNEKSLQKTSKEENAVTEQIETIENRYVKKEYDNDISAFLD